MASTSGAAPATQKDAEWSGYSVLAFGSAIPVAGAQLVESGTWRSKSPLTNAIKQANRRGSSHYRKEDLMIAKIAVPVWPFCWSMSSETMHSLLQDLQVPHACGLSAFAVRLAFGFLAESSVVLSCRCLPAVQVDVLVTFV